jgi:hypothetical protein
MPANGLPAKNPDKTQLAPGPSGFFACCLLQSYTVGSDLNAQDAHDTS